MQLQKTERKEISYLKTKGYGIRAIAKIMNRAPSTISREISRNTVNGSYIAHKANIKSYQRRYWVQKELPRLWDKDWQPFREFMEKKLSQEHPWSPEQICGRWTLDHSDQSISYSTIYRFVHNWEWRLHKKLPHQRYRWKRKKRGTPKRALIPNRIWIDDRPKIVDSRETMGHWEGDTLGSKKGETENILGVIERKSRFLRADIMPNRKPHLTAKKMRQWHQEHHFKSITLDNGIEFRNHDKIGCDTFFCHPYSSWEKGQVEYSMRLLRRLIPKKSSLQNISRDQLRKFVEILNHTPRKCLNFKTPHEVFYNLPY
jgi:IS30 family transposase